MRFICRPSAASPPLLSLCSLPHHSLPPPLHCSIFPPTGSLLCPGVCCDLLYVKTLFSPPFSSLTCCPLPFTAKPHERVVYSLQFLNIHSVPGRVLPTSVLAAMQKLFYCHPSLSSFFLSFLPEQPILVFLGMPHSALCRLSIGHA